MGREGRHQPRRVTCRRDTQRDGRRSRRGSGRNLGSLGPKYRLDAHRRVIMRAHDAKADFLRISLESLPQPVITPQVGAGLRATEALDLMQFRGVASQSRSRRGLARQGKIQACRYPCKRRASQTVQRRARRPQGGGSNLPSGSARVGEAPAAPIGSPKPTRDPS